MPLPAGDFESNAALWNADYRKASDGSARQQAATDGNGHHTHGRTRCLRLGGGNVRLA